MNTPTNAGNSRSPLDQITEKAIACVHQVSSTLGAGFQEKIYENALAFELRQVGLTVAQRHHVEVRYKGALIGDYISDHLIVDECIVIEVKAVKFLDEQLMNQCMNYLSATGVELCLLVNFGTPQPTIKRISRNR